MLLIPLPGGCDGHLAWAPGRGGVGLLSRVLGCDGIGTLLTLAFCPPPLRHVSHAQLSLLFKKRAE